MSTPAPPTPPPDPEGVTSWSEFTARLRELYEWCDSPKYRALSGRVTGLSPAAISNLIGRNPLVRPPESASLRFIEACLRFRGHPEAEAELARWKARWDGLAEHQGTAAQSPADSLAAPRAAAPPPAPGLDGDQGHGSDQPPAPVLTSGRIDAGRRRASVPPAALAGVAALVALATAAVVLVFTGDDAPEPPATGGTTESGARPVSNAAAGEICQPLDNDIHTDPRHRRLWKQVFRCANLPDSPLFEEPRSTSTQVGHMESIRSWFVCWIRGERHSGGNDIWYYSQGDEVSAKPEHEGWGFMPASRLLSTRHPNPGVLRQCPFK
ncbi:hypothetical protein [Spirillospora sp. NPDC047279]|uniref:hypothetical protein n=1 Tax=Spirillospora sp. NPDC047279 TaxID=3155478 RepID=UPI0033D30DD0